MKHTAYLAFSSNLGDRVANLRNALIALPPLMRIWAASYVYEAQSKDSSQPPFLNLVARATTDLTPLGLLKYLKKKEAELGRDPNISAGLFKIDIDILFYDDITFKKGGLIIPHPRLHERIFVLEPLAAIAPALTHPVSDKTMKELLEKCDKKITLKKYNVN